MSDTIALSSLSKRFSRVDFPTFGAPKIVTAIPFFIEFPNLKDCINFSNSDFIFFSKSLNFSRSANSTSSSEKSNSNSIKEAKSISWDLSSFN